MTAVAQVQAQEASGESIVKDKVPVWIDTRHEQVSNSTSDFANWVDSFFGHARSVDDSASSIVRIRPQFEWDEEDDTDWKLRATGKLYLPRTSERLSLVFLSEDGDFDDEFYDPALASDGESTVGLQYRVHKEERSRVDLIAGIKSGPKGKLGAKYRYQVPFGARNRFRFSEELFWIGGDGFGTLTRADIDHSLGEGTLLRWANKAEYSEESNGVEWNSRVAWIRRLDEKSAFRLFTFIRGETDPELLKSRGFGTAYRRQFLRDWLFWEIEPQYAWRKRRPETEREGVASVKLRLEIIFGER